MIQEFLALLVVFVAVIYTLISTYKMIVAKNPEKCSACCAKESKLCH